MKEIMFNGYTIIVRQTDNGNYEAVIVKPNGEYVADFNHWDQKVVVMVTGNTESQVIVKEAKEIVLEDMHIYGK